MNTMYRSIFLFMFCACCLISVYSSDKINFWNMTPQRGTNCMNEVPTEAWFRDAKEINVKWVRLVYDKWDAEGRDFLLGNADNYQGLIQKDLHTLKQVLLWADQYDLKIVITPLSLPGCRWSQNNNYQYDSRIWEQYQYQEAAIRFWVDLAEELKSYDCIVAYDIINEPCPELRTGLEEQTKVGDAERFPRWYAQYKDTPHDLYDFYHRIIQSIRQVDRDTPIMVESGFYAQPPSYCEFPDKFSDDAILYSVHVYEPYAFTSNGNFRNGAKYAYPSTIPFGDGMVLWNKNTMLAYFEPFEHWIKIHTIPLNRIVVSEFGCMRRNPGAEHYLSDMVSILEDKKYHWAFYAFREDGWDGYDYEIGTKALPWTYWQARERGEFPSPPREDNPLFAIIKKRLRY
ncbi:glycoside hydrolase family 5 protein [Hollandina sp. SP2]